MLYSLNRVRRKTGNRRGAAAVEMAIVAPVLFLLLFGIIEFGRVMLAMNVMINSSREAARLAIIDGATETQVRELAERYARAGSVNGCTVTVSPDDHFTTNSDAPVTVTVSISFNDISWLPVPEFMGGRVISCSTTMRPESFNLSAFTAVTEGEEEPSGNGNRNRNGNN